LVEELKIRYSAVEQAVSNIESAAGSFDTELPKDTGSGNRLDVVDRINELNNQL
jgi:hypothetical protein